MNISGWCKTNGKTSHFGIAAPLQVFQSDNNQFGIKITPFLEFNYFDSVYFENHLYNLDISVFNMGAKVSMGYYFMPRWHLGASYKYNIFNEKNKFTSRKSSLDIWFSNDYELSLLFDADKELTYKLGFVNNKLFFSFIWSGWEIGTGLTSSFIFARIDLY